MKCILLATLAISIMLTIAIVISACGRRNPSDDGNNAQAESYGIGVGTGVGGLHHILDGEALTIFASHIDMPPLRRAADTLQQSLARQGVQMQFNFDYYIQDDWIDGWRYQSNLLLSKFAAGVGPDIFIRDFIQLYPFIENGFIANIYTVIDQSANFSRDDFFTNVLEGLEVDGRLYVLPLGFGVDFVGINANIPPLFMSRFEALDRANFTDITSLYLDLIAEYPQWGEFALIHGINENLVLMPEFTYAVDFAGRTADLSHAVNLLDSMRRAFAGNRRFETPFVNWRESPQHELEVKQERYVFTTAIGAEAGIAGLFEFREPAFVNFVPIADEHGRLVNRRWSLEMVVSTTANLDFVMAFFEQVLADNVIDYRRMGQNIPILKRFFHEAMEVGFNNTLAQMNIPPIVLDEYSAIRQAVERLEEYATWPSVAWLTRIMPTDMILDPFNEFMTGDMSAYDAISRMEAAISDWFNEYRGPIEKYEDTAIVEERLDLPVRTLTIRTNDRHTGVIMQAAEAMNRAWARKNEPYNFHVEVEDHSWLDMDGIEARVMRLRTELMAGQGPDMFIMETGRAWGVHLDMHAMAASGFLRDIYTLMDADPNTSRDEFFTQALQAFELNNGLYMFPTSLGFEYIAINANLPQTFVDRFAQKSTITLLEMMTLYLDLTEAYYEEFGHLSFVAGSTIAWPMFFNQAVMGGYIDFNTRTSYLTDPRFIETLDIMNRVFPETNWLRLSLSGMINTTDTLRERADRYVFHVMSNGMNSFDAFFTAETPFFAHHIPLADDGGRLLLNSPDDHGQVWSGIFITAAGDGALAWEFTGHMIYAYTNPIGRAAAIPGRWEPAPWGSASLASPILRSLFRDHTLRNFEAIFDEFGTSDNIWSFQLQAFEGFDDPANRAQQFENAINRIAAYNEMPMGMLQPMIPGALYWDHFVQFMDGLISAETAAQRMHNAVSLWLIE